MPSHNLRSLNLWKNKRGCHQLAEQPNWGAIALPSWLLTSCHHRITFPNCMRESAQKRPILQCCSVVHFKEVFPSSPLTVSGFVGQNAVLHMYSINAVLTSTHYQIIFTKAYFIASNKHSHLLITIFFFQTWSLSVWLAL